jgi:hypothetical protein
MKKALLFAILAVSITAFAQTKRPAHSLRHATSNSENSKTRLQNIGLHNYLNISKINSGQVLNLLKDSQHSPTQLVDSVYQWKWDLTSDGWKIDMKTIDMVYDTKNNLTSEKGQKWNGAAWVDSTKSTYTYDANNNPASILIKSWTGSAWENSKQINTTFDVNNNWTSFELLNWGGSAWTNFMKFIWTYDANNNQTSEIFQGGDSLNWVNGAKTVWTFDSNNNNTVKVSQIWSDSLSVWENNSQSIFTYDANKNTTNEIEQLWKVNTWDNFQQTSLTYDARNNNINELHQFWGDGAWGNAWQYIYAYDANNNQISELDQNWFGSWENSTQYLYTYDANNNLLTELDQDWDLGGSMWMDSYKYSYTYDAKNNQTSELDQFSDGSNWLNIMQNLALYDINNFKKSESKKEWDNFGTMVISGDSTYYFYHTVVTGIPGPTEANTSIYPNPSRGKIIVSSNSTINAIEIYTLSGKRIYADFKVNQQLSNEIDLSGYAKGIYLLKVYNGTKFYNRKVVVQ